MIFRSNNFLESPIYRSVAEYSGDTIFTPSSRRPKRVPPLVDNIWEYFRPPAMPSRRSSAFGSPSAELAHKSGPPGGLVCRVSIAEPYILAQIVGYPDASKHPDMEIIPSFVLDSRLPEHHIHLLASELLTSEVIVTLLENSPAVIAGLKDRVKLWESCRRVILDGPTFCDPVGEFFFEAPLGYRLQPTLFNEQ